MSGLKIYENIIQTYIAQLNEKKLMNDRQLCALWLCVNRRVGCG